MCFGQPVQAEQSLGVLVNPDAKRWEKQAAHDLAHYLTLMLDLKTPPSSDDRELDLRFLVGEKALALRPDLKQKLEQVQKKDPLLRADAIVIEKDGSNIYLAGSNDRSHYYAISAFLQQQGCRWYTPTAFGEHIPRRRSLTFEQAGVAYAPPFEVRNFWIAWNGDKTDYDLFAHRNFFHTERTVLGSHGLGNLLSKQEWAKEIDLSQPTTVQKTAELLQSKYVAGDNISLGISDSIQQLSSAEDIKKSARFEDKFFDRHVVSDTFLPFYNQVIETLRSQKPDSPSLFSFLAYTNLTLPPQRRFTADPALIAFLAPIDIDPNHAYNSKISPSKQDLLGALKRWTKVMQGRVVIYDYDQAMLVWRDLPNPSHQVVRHDIKRYRDLKILGLSTESRNAVSTVFTNLFFRGQLYWNPDFNVDEELELFYSNFYGELREPMKKYWNLIYDAWEKTDVVDHEFFIATEIYTPGLIASLNEILEPVRSMNISDPILKSRIEFTLLGFDLIKNYGQMIQAAARDGRYAEAVAFGNQGLQTRETLTALNPIFTSHSNKQEAGPAWWPGEVKYYEQLSQLKQVKLLPLRWNFRFDPQDEGIWRNWAWETDFSSWSELDVHRLPRHQQQSPDGYVPQGFAWYACQIGLSQEESKKPLELIFPGIFNSSWLYVNGNLIDWKEQKSLWWANDYRFLWKAQLEQSLQPGLNTIMVRTEMKQHPSGLFRRPFLSERAKP